MAKKKYDHFEVCDGDYNDVIENDFKMALKAYREAATPRSLLGITKNGCPIPIYSKSQRASSMGDEKFPFYHPLYVPPKRDMKQIKEDYNKHLKKHSLSKTKAR